MLSGTSDPLALAADPEGVVETVEERLALSLALALALADDMTEVALAGTLDGAFALT